MKYWITLLFFGCICNAQKLDIVKLCDDFYVFTTYKEIEGKMFPSNGMYVVTRKGVVIIDSPWDRSQCQPLLDSISKKHDRKVIMCIATHFHDDRTGCLDYFRSVGIETFTSKKTYDLCVANGEPKAENNLSPANVLHRATIRSKLFSPAKAIHLITRWFGLPNNEFCTADVWSRALRISV